MMRSIIIALAQLQWMLHVADALTIRDLDRQERSVGGRSASEPAFIRSNPLKMLKPLTKPHHSWYVPSEYLSNSSLNFLDGLVHDYVRITGSCPIRLLDASSTTVQTCVNICQAVAEQRQKAGVAPASIAINWSPWYQYFLAFR